MLYEAYFKRRLRSGAHHHYWIIPLMALSEYLWLYYGVAQGLNSIFASAAGLLLPALLIVMIRRDLIRDALFSGLIFATLLALFETVLLIMAPTT